MWIALLFSSLLKFDSQGNPQPDLADRGAFQRMEKSIMFPCVQMPSGTTEPQSPVMMYFLHSVCCAAKTPLSLPMCILCGMECKSPALMIRILNCSDRTICPVLDYLTFGILPKHLLESVAADQLASNDFNLAPVGSGPYKLTI